MNSMEVPNQVLNSTPLVSVLVTTFRHAGYIEQCLNGILEQQVDFAFELLVGEDESTDGTREVCQRIAAAHPDRVRLFLRSRKDVIKIFGKPTGRANFMHLMRSARGKYVALCEGDDHWIDPKKLQRQVEAMEADPSAAGCYTNAYNETHGERVEFLVPGVNAPKGQVLEERAFLYGLAIPTCTFLFRREWSMEFQHVILPFATGDTPLFTLLLGRGHFIFQPEFTGVRVVHPGGIYSMQGAAHHLQVQLVNIHEQDKLSAFRHHDVIQQRKQNALAKAWREAMAKENWELGAVACKYLVKDRSILGWSLSQTVLAGFRVIFPKSYDRLLQVGRRLRGKGPRHSV
ncbi:MAG: glycosyltransferase [Flavobacteriales bacterium]|nr:glycosyltransferase [Flavobacteriales bacterium]